MTWREECFDPTITNNYYFVRYHDGESKEKLTPAEMTKYVNDLEDALLLVAADPRMAKLIHKTVKKHVT